jgi:hypothetical protein
MSSLPVSRLTLKEAKTRQCLIVPRKIKDREAIYQSLSKLFKDIMKNIYFCFTIISFIRFCIYLGFMGNLVFICYIACGLGSVFTVSEGRE